MQVAMYLPLGGSSPLLMRDLLLLVLGCKIAMCISSLVVFAVFPAVVCEQQAYADCAEN